MELHASTQRLFTNRDLLRLLIPLVIEQFLAIAVGMADQIMVASVGESAVSAVSLVDNITILIINIFAALATGGAVVAGQYIGQRNNRRANDASGQLLLLVTLISIVVTGFMYLGRGFILTVVFGKIEPDVAAYAETYMNITFLSIPFIALYNAGAAIFRSMRNSSDNDHIHYYESYQRDRKCVGIYALNLEIEGVAVPTLISRVVGTINRSTPL